jgi:membrane-associated phospholipid phosphatase
MSLERIIDDVEEADVAVSAEAAKLRHTPIVRAVGTLSELADQPPMFALGSALLGAGLASGNRRLAECGGRVLASVALATAVKSVVKATVVRTRPSVLVEEGRYETGLMGPNEGPWNSFPSGHTANAVAAARSVARTYPRLNGVGHAVAAGIGLIQVPRAAHHPIDVLAGALVGYAAEAAVNGAWPKVAPVLAAAMDGLDRSEPVRDLRQAAGVAPRR